MLASPTGRTSSPPRNSSSFLTISGASAAAFWPRPIPGARQRGSGGMTNVARTGQTLLIAAGGMLFAAFTSAMVVRRGLGGDWVAPMLPAWVWATALLGPLASWLIQRNQVKTAMAVGAA